MNILESAHDAIADIDFAQAIDTIEEGLASAIAFGIDASEWSKYRLEVMRLMRLQQLRLVRLRRAMKETV